MRMAICKVVASTVYPDVVSLRPITNLIGGIRGLLSSKGFKPEDNVVIILKEDYDKLVNNECKTN